MPSGTPYKRTSLLSAPSFDPPSRRDEPGPENLPPIFLTTPQSSRRQSQVLWPRVVSSEASIPLFPVPSTPTQGSKIFPPEGGSPLSQASQASYEYGDRDLSFSQRRRSIRLDFFSDSESESDSESSQLSLPQEYPVDLRFDESIAQSSLSLALSGSSESSDSIEDDAELIKTWNLDHLESEFQKHVRLGWPIPSLDIQGHIPSESRMKRSPSILSILQPRCYFYSSALGVAQTDGLLGLAGDDGTWLRSRADEGTFWIDIQQPTPEEYDLLEKVFDIHPLTLEDIQQDELRREKCDLFDNYFVIITRVIDQYDSRPRLLKPIPVAIIVLDGCIISIHPEPIPHCQNVVQRLGIIHTHNQNLVKDQITAYFEPTWIAYLLLDQILNSFEPLIQSLDVETDAIEELLARDTLRNSSILLVRIHSARKRATLLMRLFIEKVHISRIVRKKCSADWFQDELELYFEGAEDRAACMMQSLINYDDLLTAHYSTYLSLLNNHITASAQLVARTMQNLTAVGCIVVPLTLFTGIMSMNVYVPGEEEDTLVHWQMCIALLAVLACLLSFLALWATWGIGKKRRTL
ncbi:uncharacterized protein BJ171DRAFT_504021 [Polychytrium aggregatum]|uniref:uncharacterized protein n=1 Tax=Polychytrium aggregatum TaxID=110093 RepID=UPI0022FF2DED|nr:uncharacterized protein BJ171DRAFT_504021 [Polychytrium aggregatum]KAI9204909.1 hypothetical protein BJ171DRAFT_504021 [Polychytrium aggregatum]